MNSGLRLLLVLLCAIVVVVGLMMLLYWHADNLTGEGEGALQSHVAVA